MAFLSDEDYKFVYDRVPRYCVDLMVQDSEGALLLTRRDIPPFEGLWHLPGGGLRFGESIEEAIKRIAEKELGVEVEIIEIAGTINNFPDNNPGDQPRHSMSVVYKVKIPEGEATNASEASDIRFFKELPPENEMQPYHGAFLQGKI